MKKLSLVYDAEYRTLFLAMLLSVAAGVADYYGAHEGSNTMGAAMIHMLFHAVFFGGTLLFTWYLRGRTASDRDYTIDRVIDWAVLAVMISMVIYRIGVLGTLQSIDLFFEDLTRFRISCAIAIVLLLIQWQLLHRNKHWTCSSVCHITEAHVAIDALILFIVLAGSFLATGFVGRIIFGVLDVACFFVSLGIIWPIMKNVYRSAKGKSNPVRTVQ